MSLQTQPIVSHSLSPLERCAQEVLERIVLFAVEQRFLGPPSDLFALLTTSKTINFALSPEKNYYLYGRIFALKFDTAAASRRLSERWLTNKSLSTELRVRFGAFRRIRRGDDGHMLQHDLWTVFLIILEHDHKNALQLTEWARAHIFAGAVAERWFYGGYGPEFGENAGGLVCRIIWELVREADLTEVWRRKLRASLCEHVLCGYRSSSFYASEEFFMIRGQPRELEERIRGNPPASTHVQYYGHTITIAAPPLASACLSAYMLSMEPNVFRYTPGYMTEYIPGKTFSERMDDEWHRLVMCHSVTAPRNPLAGKRFTPSALVGSWKGTLIVPNIAQFRGFLDSNQQQNPLRISMTPSEAEMELREHHCLGDQTALLAGTDEDGVGEDPLNAWFPRGSIFEESNGELEVHDPDEDITVVYDTYRTDTEHPYASGYVHEGRWVSGDRVDSEEEELEQLAAEIINNGPDIQDETQGLVDNPSYIDDDEWQDTVEHRHSGIGDIMITGTMRTGDREYPLVGRIRSWDALIILLRLPSTPDDPEDTNWVFRGYVHGERHFVGRWKQTFTPLGEVGWEGGFMFRKDL